MKEDILKYFTISDLKEINLKLKNKLVEYHYNKNEITIFYILDIHGINFSNVKNGLNYELMVYDVIECIKRPQYMNKEILETIFLYGKYYFNCTYSMMSPQPSPEHIPKYQIIDIS